MNHLDFLTFQLNVFSSLSPRVPLEENLRAVMAPALAKICRHCGAEVAFHIFENVALKEVHAMAVEKHGSVNGALQDELKRRAGWDHSMSPPHGLPRYHKFEHPTANDLFSQERREYTKRTAKPELNLLKIIAAKCTGGVVPGQGDWIIVVPLGSKEFPRLGVVVAWAPGDVLESKFSHPTVHEGLVLFRVYVQRLLIRLFSNYYDMGSETYLPSYQTAGVKSVTLLCAQIRGFERLCQIIHQRVDFSIETKSECLRSLVNGFTDATARIVEKIGGRIDQLWGSGLVAVFGEYLHKPQVVTAPGCQEALESSAEIVEALNSQAVRWLKETFRIDDYKKKHPEYVDVQAAIAIDHGEVLFDYVGGARHRVFMAVGDRVTFVKQLSTAVDPPSQERKTSWGPPILLSQPAHELSRHVLRDKAGDQAGSVHRQTMIKLPSMPWEVPVFPIWPENIDRTVS